MFNFFFMLKYNLQLRAKKSTLSRNLNEKNFKNVAGMKATKGSKNDNNAKAGNSRRKR